MRISSRPSLGLRADLREDVVSRELSDEVGVSLGDVALDLNHHLLLGLAADHEAIQLAGEFLGHRSSFDRVRAIVAATGFPNLSSTFLSWWDGHVG
jgi:hypothetical protein